MPYFIWFKTVSQEKINAEPSEYLSSRLIRATGVLSLFIINMPNAYCTNLSLEISTQLTANTQVMFENKQHDARLLDLLRKKILTDYQNQQYKSVIDNGLVYLKKRPDDHEIRSALANSLSWSGSLKNAVKHYQTLLTSSYANEAKLGLAHSHSWSEHYLTSNHWFQEILTQYPYHRQARQGLLLTQILMRPRSKFLSHQQYDSDKVTREGIELIHQLQLNEHNQLSLLARNQFTSHDHLRIRSAMVELSWKNLDWLFRPKLQISIQETPHQRLFGDLTIRLAMLPIDLRTGHNNWGERAFTPIALQKGLTADYLGINLNLQKRMFGFTTNITHYEISDNNQVTEIDARIKLKLATISENFLFSIGTYQYQSRKIRAEYWTPEVNHSVVDLGVEWARYMARWSMRLTLFLGQKTSGSRAYTGKANAMIKRKIDKLWAFTIELSNSQTEPQPKSSGSAYRWSQFTFQLEKLW